MELPKECHMCTDTLGLFPTLCAHPSCCDDKTALKKKGVNSIPKAWSDVKFSSRVISLAVTSVASFPVGPIWPDIQQNTADFPALWRWDTFCRFACHTCFKTATVDEISLMLITYIAFVSIDLIKCDILMFRGKSRFSSYLHL
jgi:hypothetical protein